MLAIIIALIAGNGIKERKLEKEAAERSASYSSTLKSFSEDFNSADTETVNYYEALQMYLD